jgi:hypothetical protein
LAVLLKIFPAWKLSTEAVAGEATQ